MQTFRRRTSPHTNRGGSTTAGLTNGKGKSSSWDYLIPVLVGVLCAAALIVVYLAVFSGSSSNSNGNEKIVGNLEEARQDPSMKDFSAAKDKIRAMKDGKIPFDKGNLFNGAGNPNMKDFINDNLGNAGGGGGRGNMPDIGNLGGMFRKGKQNLADISPEDMAQYEKYAKKMNKLRPRGGPEYGKPNREQMMNGRDIDTNDIPREVPRGGVDREYKEKWKAKYGNLDGRGGGPRKPRIPDDIGDEIPFGQNDRMRDYREQMKADRMRKRDGFRDRMGGGAIGNGNGNGMDADIDERIQEKLAARERMRAERDRERGDRGDRRDRDRERDRDRGDGNRERRPGSGMSPERMREYREQMKADRIRERFGDRFQDGQGAFGGAFGNRGDRGDVDDGDIGSGAGAGAGDMPDPRDFRGGPRGFGGGMGGLGNLGGGGLADRFAGAARDARDRGRPRGGDGDFNDFREQLRNGMLNDQDIDEIIQRKKDRLRQRYANDDEQQ